MASIKAEIGTTGEVVTRKLTNEVSDLKWALSKEHERSMCGPLNTCDICKAQSLGFAYVSAWILVGATECPTLGAVLEAYNISLRPFPMGFERWRDWHRENAIQCPACEAFIYDGQSEVCDNCSPDRVTEDVRQIRRAIRKGRAQ